MPMPRGDIAKTIATMEELAGELQAVRVKFQALSDSAADEICTEDDYTLRRWASEFSDQLRSMSEHVLSVVSRAKGGDFD